MPISEKIAQEIEQNPAYFERFKELIFEILEAEENSTRYKKEFEEIVENYIDEDKKVIYHVKDNKNTIH